MWESNSELQGWRCWWQLQLAIGRGAALPQRGDSQVSQAPGLQRAAQPLALAPSQVPLLAPQVAADHGQVRVRGAQAHPCKQVHAVADQAQ